MMVSRNDQAMTGEKWPVVEKRHGYLVFKNRYSRHSSRGNLAKQTVFATGTQKIWARFTLELVCIPEHFIKSRSDKVSGFWKP